MPEPPDFDIWEQAAADALEEHLAWVEQRYTQPSRLYARGTSAPVPWKAHNMTVCETCKGVNPPPVDKPVQRFRTKLLCDKCIEAAVDILKTLGYRPSKTEGMYWRQQSTPREEPRMWPEDFKHPWRQEEREREARQLASDSDGES